MVVMLALGMAIGACAKKEEKLKGERLDIRPTEQVAETEAPKVTSLSIPAAQNHAQWTHKNGNTAHAVQHPALSSGLRRVWAQNIGAGNSKKNRLTSDPVVAGGRIYTMDAMGQVRGFRTTGTPVWNTDLTPKWDKGGKASGGGLAYGDGVLAATTGFGEIIALDPATGRIRWRHKTNAAISAAPLVDGGLVIAVSLDNKAVALDVTNGRIRWQIQSGGSIAGLSGAGAPAALGEFVAVPFASGELVGASTKTGARVWSAAVSGGRKGLARSNIGAI